VSLPLAIPVPGLTRDLAKLGGCPVVVKGSRLKAGTGDIQPTC